MKCLPVLDVRPDVQWEASLRQVSIYCFFSGSNPPFSALLCDTRAEPCRHFSFANWLSVNFITRWCYSGSRRWQWWQETSLWGLGLHLYYLLLWPSDPCSWAPAVPLGPALSTYDCLLFTSSYNGWSASMNHLWLLLSREFLHHQQVEFPWQSNPLQGNHSLSLSVDQGASLPLCGTSIFLLIFT
jgi:hypothetical protein